MTKRRYNMEDSDKDVILESDEDDIKKLEDSIVCDDSPVKEIKRQCIRRYAIKNKNTPVTPVYVNESSPSQSHSVVSDRISEYGSANSSPVALTQTPMAEWIYKDQTNEDDGINNFESPNKHSTINRKPTKRGSLLQSFKAVKTRYNTSVQLFKYDHRKGKYAEENALQLVIRKILGRHDKLLETIAFDLKEEKDRWILFKPQDTLEIVEGTSLKLYLPWQEIITPGSTCPMIIGADFYKIIPDGFETSRETMECVRNLPLPKPFSLHVSEPLFMNFVPYTLKNNNTVKKQVEKFCVYINVDVLVLHVWKFMSPAIALVKDSDELISLLEIDTAYQGAISLLSRSKYVKLTQVIFNSKIKISEKMELFSIISLYGQKQTYYYVMRVEPDTKFAAVTFLNISMPDSYIDLKTVEDVCESVSTDDYRVSLRCRIRQEQTKGYLLVTGDSSLEMKIELLTDSKSLVPVECFNKFVVLKFIRLVYGKAIWDQYSYLE